MNMNPVTQTIRFKRGVGERNGAQINDLSYIRRFSVLQTFKAPNFKIQLLLFWHQIML